MVTIYRWRSSVRTSFQIFKRTYSMRIRLLKVPSRLFETNVYQFSALLLDASSQEQQKRSEAQTRLERQMSMSSNIQQNFLTCLQTPPRCPITVLNQCRYHGYAVARSATKKTDMWMQLDKFWSQLLILFFFYSFLQKFIKWRDIFLSVFLATAVMMIFSCLVSNVLTFWYKPASQLLPIKHEENCLVELLELIYIMNSLHIVSSMLHCCKLLTLRPFLFL